MVPIKLFLPELRMSFVPLCCIQVWVTTFRATLLTYPCKSLWDRVCCQDWHTDRYGCILAVCFLPQVLCSEVAQLIAQNSVFGWIVSGSLSSGSSASLHNVSHQLLCVNVCDDIVRSFWELESVDIVSEGLESVIDAVLQEFENSVDFVDGQYEVKLPWCRGASSRLQNDEKLAAIRLQNLNHHLMHEPELQVKYDSVIQNMWSSGIV